MELISQGSEYTIEDCQMALKTAFFEREYNKTLAKTAQLLDVERRRITQVEYLLLQVENENLQSQMDQIKQELVRAKAAELDVRTWLQETIQERDLLQRSAHTTAHEIKALRRELESMGNATVESRSLIADKLRLSKEVTSLQSEIERLRLQDPEILVAEKQTLDRHINTLEVELENEKRAHESTLAREAQQVEQISVLSSKLEEQRKHIAAEAQKSVHQGNSLRQSEKAALEEEIEVLNRKLQTARDQLRQAQISMQSNSGPAEQTRKVPLKDFSGRFHPELDIATPGAVRVKDGKKQPTALPGDKSAFSITPFLNRTSGQGDNDDVTHLSGDDSALETSYLEDRLHKVPQAEPQEHHRPTQAKPRLEKPKLAGASRKASNMKPAADDSDNDDIGSIGALVSGHPQARTKRRKLGAQSKMIVDEEEEELEPEDVRKPGRKVGLSTGRNTQAAPSGQTRGFGGFGGFSPLKRDRKR
ncbi:uncharacterized protein BO80DRAFT_43172 [Aspergillus ibericus CBS 121593]|uniref:Uncharacterized protein n=1 Tax=Aspergillus ibericus CBS 121593 TaxID=1448316 RepID=A0A395H2Y3_9EURO|nr:hypothetical protein BO80DRAFT_43172 [Aspergillus ibericus CBS 121593]RAL02247.1 hypothetical protein BO80DRAFT_43172 [Aspergillus ibericus CBS 121593]